jgi:hypothetical protein
LQSTPVTSELMAADKAKSKRMYGWSMRERSVSAKRSW